MPSCIIVLHEPTGPLDLLLWVATQVTMVRVDVFVLQTDCGRLVLSRVKDIGQASLRKVQTYPPSTTCFKGFLSDWLVTIC